MITQQQLTLVRQMICHPDFDDAMFDEHHGGTRLKLIALECLVDGVPDRELKRLMELPKAIHKIYQ